MKKDRKTKSGLSAVFCIGGEMIEKGGEDSFYYGIKNDEAVVAVFDGCGGIGSRRYSNFSEKTGAYVASRAVCGGVKAWFESERKESIRSYIKRALSVCTRYADKEGRLVGSLGKAFPTTGAIIKSREENSNVHCTCYWAGDSRCYMMDEDGLYQLSADDIDGEDAFSNISGDGVLTNVINASADFEIHEKQFVFKKPCFLIAATDGCFGYLKSPMEFEYLISDALRRSSSVDMWKKIMDEEIKKYTGDDYTLCMAVYAEEDFHKLKKKSEKRCEALYGEYIADGENFEEKWNKYKDSYCRYM